MIQVKNNDNQTIKFSGKSEGCQIFSHLISNAVGTSPVQPNYGEITFEWKCTLPNGQSKPVFFGTLNMLFQSMLLLAGDITKRMAFVNQTPGLVMAVGQNVRTHCIADLSFYHTPYEGDHEIIIRSGQVFPTGFETSSYLNVDFNSSDDDPETPFILQQDNIPYGSSVKSFEVMGNVGGVVYVQSDNVFIETNVGAFNGQNEHPLDMVTCSSPLFNSMLHGNELQALLCDDVNGYIKDNAGTLVQHFLQKSLVLSERDLLVRPKFDFQINSASMVSGVSYNVISKVFV